MKGRNWKDWFKKAVVESVDWKYVLSASLLAGALSILKSVAGLPEEEKNA